ncbi:citrate transporter [Oscillospiraceae bacterium MB08-C2-2]|nr:citrate transporter [Oscillospiraceae bacterium MB08-C2-2]
MEYLIGILLLISFFWLAYYCFKGHNLMIGFLIMSFLWTALPLIGNQISSPAFLEANGIAGIASWEALAASLAKIFQSAPEGWGTILVNVLWGAWFGRVLMETGIAATIIRKTVELGGDRPIITVSLLNFVTTVIFTSMTGAGPVIAIGVIVLPILMSLGIPKPLALFTFVGAVGAGSYMNPVYFAQYRAFHLAADQMPEFSFTWYVQKWGIYAIIIMLLVTTIGTAFYLKAKKPVHSWAAQTGQVEDTKQVPGIALITPILPVLGVIFLKIPVILGFVLCGFFALFVCGKLKHFKESCQLVNKMYYDGVVDTAPLIGFLLTLPMFNKAAELCAPYFKAVVGPVMPKTTLVLCILFAILSPLGLFRGPMTLVGCGAATLGVVSNLGISAFTVPFLYACFAIPTITMNVGSCITQSWVAWGLAYTKVEGKDLLRYTVPNGIIVSILLYIVTFLVFGNGLVPIPA